MYIITKLYNKAHFLKGTLNGMADRTFSQPRAQSLASPSAAAIVSHPPSPLSSVVRSLSLPPSHPSVEISRAADADVASSSFCDCANSRGSDREGERAT